MIRNQWNSFFDDMKATLIFLLHTNDEINDIEIFDSYGKTRIHSLSDFKAIN